MTHSVSIMKPNYSKAVVLKSRLLCSVAGFLLTVFFLRGIFWERRSDWGFESWWNYKNTLCVLKPALAFFARLILHTAEYITSSNLMSQGFALWMKSFSVVRNVMAAIGWSKVLFFFYPQEDKDKKICFVQLLIPHQTDLFPAGACHKALEANLENSHN